MTISNNYVPVRTSGNGVTAAFSGNWQIIAQGYERVYWEDKTTGVQTLKVLGTDYSLVFDESGFTVTFLAGHIPPSTVYVVIARVISEEQSVPFKVSTGFDGKVQENAFDKVTGMSQDLQEQILRTPAFPVGTDTSSIEAVLPLPVDMNVPVWSGANGDMVNIPITDISTVSANIANINAVAGDLTAINNVAADLTNINTVSTNITNINSVGGAISNINSVAGSITAVNTNATNIASINTNATNIVAIQNAASNAAIAQAAAAAATAAAVGLANEWLFATSTTMADPGTGKFRFDNASFGSVANLAISALSGDSGNPNLRTFIQTWDDSNHSPRGIIRIEKNATNFVIFGVNGALTDNTTWLEIPVIVIASLGSFSASDITFVGFTPYGNDGSGTVNSVALATPPEFTVTGSPVTVGGTLTFTKNNQNANLVYAGPASGGAAAPAFRALVSGDIPGKTIKQIVQATKTDTFTTSSGSLVDVTGLSLSITPTSAASQILLMAMVSVGLTTGVTDAFLALCNAGGPLLLGQAAGSRTVCTAAVYPSHQNAIDTVPMTYVDSPGSTSPQTYKVQIAASSGTAAVNASGADTNTAGLGRAASSLIAIEIG